MKKITTPFTESEKGIQQAVKNYLRYRGWKVLRLNSGRFKVGDYLVRGQDAGTPDLLAHRALFSRSGSRLGAELLYVEIKTATGKTTYLQEQKMKELEGFGAKCMVAKGIEDLQAVGI